METIRCYNFKPNCFSQTKIAGCIFYSFVCRFCKNNCKRIAIFLGLFLCFALMVFFSKQFAEMEEKNICILCKQKVKKVSCKGDKNNLKYLAHDIAQKLPFLIGSLFSSKAKSTLFLGQIMIVFILWQLLSPLLL